MSGAIAVGTAAEVAADSFVALDAVTMGEAIASPFEVASAADVAGIIGGDAAAAEAGGIAAGAAGGAAGDAITGSAASPVLNSGATAAGDTVAGSGPTVASGAASTPGVSDTAANVASKMSAVQPDYIAQGLEGPGVPGSQSAAGLPSPSVTPASAPPSSGDGLIGSIMKLAKSPQVIAGGLQAIGGMGKAAVDRGTMERKAQLDLQKQIELAQWQDSFNHGAASGPFNVSPGSMTLTRSDGTPVYSAGSGLINRARV